MKILAQTKLTPVVTVYDSTEPGGSDGALKRFLQPVVSVQGDDGTVIYSTGEFYETYVPMIAAVIGAVIIGLAIRGALK